MILLTGATGYIGSHTWLSLLDSGYDVIGVDNFSNSNPHVLSRLKSLTNKKLSFYESDISDKSSLSNIFSTFHIEAVVHFAAFKSVRKSIKDPISYFVNNLGSLLNLIEIMKQFNCKTIIFSSSACIYGAHNDSPLKESLHASPINPYGYSKLLGEIILNNLVDFKVGILRYFNPIGAHFSGVIGECSKDTPENLMPYLLQVASRKLPHLTIFGSDYPTLDGTPVRDYIHVLDLADSHVFALNYLLNQGRDFTLNIGNGKGYTVLEIIKAFERVNEVSIPFVLGERRDGDAAITFAEVSRAKEVLGWSAKYNLDDMCKSAWYWQKMNPKGYGI